MNHNNIGLKIKCLSNSIKRGLNHLALTSLPEEFRNMTGTQGMFIGFIEAHAPTPIYQRDIETAFNIRRPTATKILQLMEQNELIVREPVPEDARLKKLVPTQKGKFFNQFLQNNLKNMDKQIRKNISNEDLEIFIKVLDQMIQNAEELS